MSDQFVAEIRIVGFSFAPIGWAFCDGQIIPLSQNTALFSLLGTYYGGNGKSNFALPDLQGSAPLQQGQGPGLSLYDLGQSGGAQFVTLLTSEIPSHTHSVQGSPGNNRTSPASNTWSSLGSTRTPPPLYSDTQNTLMSPAATATTGGSLPHNNMPPYLTMNFIIALQGIFPPRP